MKNSDVCSNREENRSAVRQTTQMDAKRYQRLAAFISGLNGELYL